MSQLINPEAGFIKSHLIENQIIGPSYSHYDGLSGFQDYGVIGFQIKKRLLNHWRNHFLHTEEFDEIETPIITPREVLKASGHVDRFSDYIITNTEGKDERADHLVKKHMKETKSELIKEIDAWDGQQLETYINKYQLAGQDVEVKKKKLMYHLSENEFMRPELAQGIFVNFNQIYLRKNSLPFGIAQIGKSYRNEISPKPFLRLREFTQAEIEYFFDPEKPEYKNFSEIQEQIIPLFSAQGQKNGENSINIRLIDAFNQKLIKTEILAYFLGRIFQFALSIGLDHTRIRFRQHLPNEMAHYASDCWDLECLIDDDWVECVGCANRQDHDIKAHSTKKEMIVKRNGEKIIYYIIKPDVKKISLKYQEKTQLILKSLQKLQFQEINQLQHTIDLNIGEEIISLDSSMYSPIKMKKYDEYYPHVIEPSFGIDRLMFALLDHNLKLREDDQKRGVLTLKPFLAPYDVAIFQLSNKPELIDYTLKIKEQLKKHNFCCFTDLSSTAIGKRYVRADEIGIPLAVTIDFETLKNETLTIRERDSKTQIRLNKDQLIEYIFNLLKL